MDIAQLQNLEASGEPLLDFGLQPVSNRFLSACATQPAPSFPLQLRLCSRTGLLHLGKPFPIEELRPRYDWLTCFEPEAHLDDLVQTLLALPGIDQESVFAGYSFKDDSTLARVQKLGYSRTWRIDPERDLGVGDPCASVETYQAAFDSKRAEQIYNNYGAADVLIVRHVLEHAYNLPQFIQAIRALIKPTGYIVWEIPDCERSLALGDYTTIWEEHVFYFTSFTFRYLLQSLDFQVIYYESIPYPLENSLIAVVQMASFGGHSWEVNSQAIAQEIKRARRFAKIFSERRKAIRTKLECIRQELGSIALFGAGHLAVAFISLMEISDLVDWVIDDNPYKNGLKMPLGDLRIVGSDALYNRDIKVCLLSLNPQNQPKVVAKHQKFIDGGGLFASIFPGSDLSWERVL